MGTLWPLASINPYLAYEPRVGKADRFLRTFPALASGIGKCECVHSMVRLIFVFWIWHVLEMVDYAALTHTR